MSLGSKCGAVAPLANVAMQQWRKRRQRSGTEGRDSNSGVKCHGTNDQQRVHA